MRKVFVWGLLLMFFITMPQFIGSAEAGKDKWKTRKLIKNGDLNYSHWWDGTEDGEGTPIANWSIAADESYVQFIHEAGMEHESAWLGLNSANECVKGIEVEVKMGNDLAGDLLVRVATSAGAYGPFHEYTWGVITIRNREADAGGDRLFGLLDVLPHTAEADWDWSQSYLPVWTQFHEPVEVDGNTYRIQLIVDRDKDTVQYAVNGLGSTTFKMPEDLQPGWECFWAIGTRSLNPEGYGTVQFGNKVKVLYDGKCKPDKSRPKITKTWPGNKEKNVAVDIDQIKLQFNEAMDAWPSYCEDGSCCPELHVKNPITGAYEFIENLCGCEYVGTKEFIFHKTEGDPDLLPGLWYKIVVPENYFGNLARIGNSSYSFRFKTKAP